VSEPGTVDAPTEPRPEGRSRWAIFVVTALLVVVADQASKAAIAARLEPGESIEILGSWLVFVHGQNTGALFGLLGQSATILAIVSPFVIGAIVWYQARAGSSPLIALALGLLLGGAIGNLIDRLRFGYVLDWVDAGIGGIRFWTFNIADSAITISILLLFLVTAVPSLAALGGGPSPAERADA
jgi:signal peptidase II